MSYRTMQCDVWQNLCNSSRDACGGAVRVTPVRLIAICCCDYHPQSHTLHVHFTVVEYFLRCPRLLAHLPLQTLSADCLSNKWLLAQEWLRSSFEMDSLQWLKMTNVLRRSGDGGRKGNVGSAVPPMFTVTTSVQELLHYIVLFPFFFFFMGDSSKHLCPVLHCGFAWFVTFATSHQSVEPPEKFYRGHQIGPVKVSGWHTKLVFYVVTWMQFQSVVMYYKPRKTFQALGTLFPSIEIDLKLCVNSVAEVHK